MISGYYEECTKSNFPSATHRLPLIKYSVSPSLIRFVVLKKKNSKTFPLSRALFCVCVQLYPDATVFISCICRIAFSLCCCHEYAWKGDFNRGPNLHMQRMLIQSCDIQIAYSTSKDWISTKYPITHKRSHRSHRRYGNIDNIKVLHLDNFDRPCPRNLMNFSLCLELTSLCVSQSTQCEFEITGN